MNLDLERARASLEPSTFEPSWLSRISWHAWPAAILVKLITAVCFWQLFHPRGADRLQTIHAMQNSYDLPKVAVIVGLLATCHILVNLGVLIFDRSHPFGRRLLDALSILISLPVLVWCLAVAVFLQMPALTP